MPFYGVFMCVMGGNTALPCHTALIALYGHLGGVMGGFFIVGEGFYALPLCPAAIGKEKK
jgi:hypothetical protein